MCGKTVADGIKLEIDHIIPLAWEGTNDIDNLQTLCSICFDGKKQFLSDFDQKIMSEVLKEKNSYQKLVKFFILTPNITIEPTKLKVISGIRNWAKTIRRIRNKEKLNIVWIRSSEANKQSGYMLKTQQ
jgi:hypothetical protein